MPDVDGISECSSDVVIEIVESLQVFPGLLAVAIVFGVLFGIIAAALLYVFFLKPVLLNRKFHGYDTRKLFEADDLDQEDNKSDSVSVGKKTGQSAAQNERERKQLPMNSDVAAFALKAKVVYPINQRYRPLADGASNPSLHENSRLAMLPNPESSSSSSLDSLSQENDEDSSQFVSSSPIPNTFQNDRFIRVSHFPETFTCAGFEGRISLYCLGLQNFQHLCSKLQEEKHVFHGYDTRKLFEADDLDQEDNKSDSVSVGKKTGQSAAQNERERKQLPMNSDVAAFALKAKVVYPINQRYRPLADGASNPSLHENSRLAMLPNPESSSSSSLDSLSQENDEDSSQFVSSSPIPNTFQNDRFIRVSHFPETFTCAGFEGRISLYCLGLQNFQHLCSKLQEEKHVLFLQILRIIFGECYRKEKIDSAFYSKVLLIQERELQDLKKELSVKLFNSERKEDPNSIYCTLEEIERAGKDRLEHGLQMVVGFSRQVERLCLHLRSRPGTLSREVVAGTTRGLVHGLLQVESQLAELQIAHTRSLQEKLLWWEELGAWLQSRPALLRQEAVCRLGLVAKALEQLTSDGQLSFSHMESLLSEVQSALREELQHCSEECTRQTKELVHEMYRKADLKRKKLMKSQAKERGRALDDAQLLRDPLEFVKAYSEVLEKQRKQSGDLEEQQEWSVTEAVCELWKRVHSSWSDKLADRVKDLFLTALPALTQLAPDACDRLRREADRDLSAQLQREEAAAKQNLQGLQEQLDLDRQIWLEEEALVSASLRHMCDQQLKILSGMAVKQKDMQECVDSLMEEKHRLLLAAVQRQFMARHFTLRALKEMRFSRLKMPSVSDSKVVELEDCSKTQHTASLTPRSVHKECPASEAERRLGPEALLIGQGFQQEFLSELDTGAELLQEHAQLLMGHALAHSVHQQGNMEASTQPRPQDSRKLPLVEAASESVYVTRGSINSLIQTYYTQIQSVARTQQQDQQHNLESSGGECDRASGRSLLYRALLKELANWERKPTSREFHQRVEMQKKKILAQYDVDLEAAYDTLRKRKSDLHHGKENLKSQLQETEETFMIRLAAMARVPLTSRESECAKSQPDKEVLDECKRNTGLSKDSVCILQHPGNRRQGYEQAYLQEDTGKRKKNK